MTAIWDASVAGNIRTVRRLVLAGNSPLKRDGESRIPLMLAAAHGHVVLV